MSAGAERAILLVDHGSRLEPANAVIEQIAAALRGLRPDARVEVAHLELAEPDFPAALARCVEAGVREVVVVPYFLAPGRHTSRDIPRLVAEAGAAHPGLRLRVADPLGFDARLVELVLARADAAREAAQAD